MACGRRPKNEFNFLAIPQAHFRCAAEENIRAGADVIKLQGGMTFDEYKAVVAVAHRYHVKVCPKRIIKRPIVCVPAKTPCRGDRR